MSFFDWVWMELNFEQGPWPWNSLLRAFLGHEYKICELTWLILGHLNREEYNFEFSFSYSHLWQRYFQPCKGFAAQVECFCFVRNVFYVWGDLSFVRWRVSHKDTCFGGQLFSVELEEGFLCAGIRFPKKRLPISLFSRVFQESSMIGWAGGIFPWQLYKERKTIKTIS